MNPLFPLILLYMDAGEFVGFWRWMLSFMVAPHEPLVKHTLIDLGEWAALDLKNSDYNAALADLIAYIPGYSSILFK